MAIAIPLIAFGVLYVLSNQKKEQFELRRNFPTTESVMEYGTASIYKDKGIGGSALARTTGFVKYVGG